MSIVCRKDVQGGEKVSEYMVEDDFNWSSLAHVICVRCLSCKSAHCFQPLDRIGLLIESTFHGK